MFGYSSLDPVGSDSTGGGWVGGNWVAVSASVLHTPGEVFQAEDSLRQGTLTESGQTLVHG